MAYIRAETGSSSRARDILAKASPYQPVLEQVWLTLPIVACNMLLATTLQNSIPTADIRVISSMANRCDIIVGAGPETFRPAVRDGVWPLESWRFAEPAIHRGVRCDSRRFERLGKVSNWLSRLGVDDAERRGRRKKE